MKQYVLFLCFLQFISCSVQTKTDTLAPDVVIVESISNNLLLIELSQAQSIVSKLRVDAACREYLMRAHSTFAELDTLRALYCAQQALSLQYRGFAIQHMALVHEYNRIMPARMMSQSCDAPISLLHADNLDAAINENQTEITRVIEHLERGGYSEVMVNSLLNMLKAHRIVQLGLATVKKQTGAHESG